MPVPDALKTEAALAQEMEAVYRLYLALADSMHPETGLGGQLLFAGIPDEAGSRLLRAANIAGAASLAVSADAAGLRQAMRAGVVDFIVNSLDEALRILKNEIRKRQPVAVGVSVEPSAILHEMLDRGVQPDLLAAHLPAAPALAAFQANAVRIIEPHPLPPGCNFHLFPIPPDWKQPAAAFDALLLDCLAPGDFIHRRWVRLAPRYLGAEARRLRSLGCDANAARQLAARLGGIRAE